MTLVWASFAIFEVITILIVRTMKRLSIALWFLLVCISCKTGVYANLDYAESILHEKPDSALLALKAIETSQLKTREAKARYALLLSAAYDKNYIDIKSDTLISVATSYYSEHGTPRYRMLAWYYDGVVLKNGSQHTASIIAFEKAEKEAKALDDNYQLGLIFRNKAGVFSYNYNDKDAIECCKKSIYHFELANAPTYKASAEFALATAYSNNKQFSEADSLFSFILEHYSDPKLIAYSNIRWAGLLVNSDIENEKALYLYRKTSLKYHNLQDFARRALAHERLGERDSATFWLSRAYSRCKNTIDTTLVDNQKIKILFLRGDFKNAFDTREKVFSMEDSLTRSKLFQSVTGAQRDYYISENLRQEEQLHHARQQRIQGWIIGLLLALTGILLFWGYSREKDRQLQEQINRLALKEKELAHSNKTNAHLLGSLFSARIEHLDQLYRDYINTENKQEREDLFKQIKQTVSTLRHTPEAFEALEQDLDRYCDGVMSKLRAQVPKIRGNNLQIITLFFAGFSYEAVQLIMNSVSIESLKTARSRFRKEILAAHAPDEAFLLEMLEVKN